MPMINGKSVTFVSRLNASVWWELFPVLAKVERGQQLMELIDFPTAVKLAQASIEGWEFEGDPQDPKVYEKMDIRDFGDLVAEAVNHAIDLINQETDAPGESEKPST